MNRTRFTKIFAIALLALLFNYSAARAQTPYDINTIVGGISGNGSSATAIGLAGPEIAVDPTGAVYVASFYGSRVYKIAANGVLTVVAGNGSQGYSGDGGPATSASLDFPNGIAVDSAGTLYIADTFNNRIRKVVNGTITTFAGNGTAGFSGDNGVPTSASLSQPVGLTLDSTGTILYIADLANNRIRKVTNNVITTVAGNGTAGFAGDGGQATAAQLNQPRRLALDLNGNLYIADTNNHRIRQVLIATGVISTVAGSGTEGFSGDGGSAILAALDTPAGVAVDNNAFSGGVQIYIADSNNQRIRKVSGGTITTLMGNGVAGFSGDGGPAASAMLSRPLSILKDNQGNFYIQDDNNNRVRKVIGTTISTYAGGGSGGDGGFADLAMLIDPYGVFVDSNNNVYVAETANNRVRKITPASFTSSGTITTIAGNGIAGFSGDNGPAVNASLNFPQTVVVDNSGNVYIADSQNNRIRKVTPGGIITTVAGNGTFGFSGDGGLATAAALATPLGIGLDISGNLYIADTYNHRIRSVINGNINTVAGNGTAGFSGDGGPPLSASLSYPQTVIFNSSNNLFILDSGNNRVRFITSTNVILTEAGNGTYGFTGDGGPATSAELADPLGLAIDPAGNLVIVDTYNQRIRLVSDGFISTIAGTGTPGYSGDGALATDATLDHPVQVAADRSGNLLVADANNSRIRLLSPIFSVVVTTAPAGLSVIVDGTTFTSPQIFEWAVGSSHTIGTISPQSAGVGARYVFGTWSDGGAISHTITVPASSATYTANFNTQYLLSTSVVPTASGIITPNPLSALRDGFYNSGASVQLTATPNSGYTFANWTGALAGSTNPQSIAMSAPRSVTANFSATVCTYSLNPPGSPGATVPANGGGPFSVAVTAPTGCPWTATNSGGAGWVSITSGASGSGNGAVGYSVQANPLSGPRSTTLTIAGQAFSLTESGQGCLVSLSPGSISVPPTGGSGNVNVGLSGSDCAWTAITDLSWVTLTGSTGTGNGILKYSIGSATTGRSGSITITPATGTPVLLPVQETGVTCTYSLPQASQGFASAGGTGAASIVAPAGCTWTAQSTVNWITLTSNSGAGNGAAGYNVAPNASNQPRSGSVLIAGQTYTVIEAAAVSSQSNPPTCTASVPTVPQVALEGRTEVLGDLVLTCSGIATSFPADILLTLNTNVSNTLTGTNTIDAQLTVNSGTAQLGQILGAAGIRWPGVTLAAGPGGVTTVRISKVRADASLLGPSHTAVAVTGQVNINARVTVPVINAQPTLANASPALVFQIGAPSSGTVPLSFQEARVGAFQAGTRLHVKLSQIPVSVGICEPFNSLGANSAQLFSADASGLGGSPITGSGCQSMAISQQVATGTWVVPGPDSGQIENWVFPMQVFGATDLSTVKVSATLGPVSDVSSANATAPLPRYRDFGTPLNLVNLRLTTQMSGSTTSSAAPQGTRRAAAQIGRDSIQVGSNQSFVFQVLNDTSDQSQSANGVGVQYGIPLGLNYQGCTITSQPAIVPPPSCSFLNNVVQGDFGTLGPGGSGTLTVQTIVDSGLTNGTVLTNVATAFVGGNNQVLYDPRSGVASSSLTVGASPTMLLSPSSLNFGCSQGIVTGPQAATISFTGASGLNWTAAATGGITVNGAAQATGSGNATITIAAGCGISGSVTVSAPGLGNVSQSIQVTSTSASPAPIVGSFDTPPDGTPIVGAVGVTGWALDPVGVANVGIWRNPVPGEPTASNGLVFIGDAVFVTGARPDVALAYPNLPNKDRAGWGYQLLTNFLPNAAGSGSKGNGTYKLHAIVTNLTGQTLDLGTHSIIVDNTHAAKPFGTIDTPAQGGTASGSAFVNFGWALTPNPFSIPTNGSTLQVVVDSVIVGHPVYNNYRSDIATQFSGFANSNGAVGFYSIDTTLLTNGIHTISWNAYDNVGHGEGLGSRYFNVLNSGTTAAPAEAPTADSLAGGVRLRSGFDRNAPRVPLAAGTNGVYAVDLETFGRIELSLGASEGHLLVGDEEQPLPLGSTLKAGVFYWQAPLGFLGDYDLMFLRPDGTEVQVRVHIGPKTGAATPTIR